MVDVLTAPQQIKSEARTDSSLRTLVAISSAHWVSHFHMFVVPMLFPFLKEQLGVVTYFALASGFLTGKYRTAADAAKSARGKGVVEKFLNARGLKILEALDDVAMRHRASPASVALAWQIARPSITAPIASATTVEQLNDLVAATRLHLDESDIEQLNAASA